MVPTISYLPALTVDPAPCQVQVKVPWVDLNLGLVQAQALHNSMVLVLVVPEFQILLLTVVLLLVIIVVNLLQGDQVHLVPHFHLVQDQMAPVVRMVHHPVVPQVRDPMDLTINFLDRVPQVLITLDLTGQVLGLVLLPMVQWVLMVPCMVHLHTLWTGQY